MFVGLAIVVGGGIYYFFGVHEPSRAKARAQDEIARWEPGFAKARACLLGPKPASPKAGEAIAIREMTEVVDYKKCTAAISALARNNTEDTGDTRIEGAWRTVGSSVSTLAASFSTMLIPGTEAKQRGIDKLGAALDALDEAVATLRAVAGVDEPQAPTIAKLGTVELLPLNTGRKARLTAWLRPSAGGMIALAEKALENTAPRQLVLVPGEPPRSAPHQSAVRPSITDATFAVSAGDGELELGKLTPAGTVEGGTKVSTGAKTGVPHVLFALGGAADAAIAYIPDAARTPVQVSVARMVPPPPAPPGTGSAFVANAAPVVEAGTPIEADDYAFALAPPARGLLAWSTAGALRGALVKPNAAPKVVDLGSGTTGLSCLTATHGWIASGDQFVRFDDTGATPHVLPGHELVGCDDTSVLLRKAGHRYSVCTQTCRIVELQGAGDAVPALSGGQVIAVGTSHKVLAVWREKGPPSYFVLPDAIKPRLVHATAKVIDVIAENETQGMVIARIKL
jgi:hypothetical protein